MKRLLLVCLSLSGTTHAQYLVKDIRTSPVRSGTTPGGLTSVFGGAFVYFNANDANGWEPWRTDGTTAGTVLVKDINPGNAGSSPTNFTSFLGKVYFSATDATKGTELWVTDGTAAGTAMVMDIYAGSRSSDPASFKAVGSNLFFTAVDATNGRELWKYDGTTVSLVKDINPGTPSSTPENFADLLGTLVFSAQDATGYELWRSDGTAAGTVQIKDINTTSASAGSSPTSLVVLGSQVIFKADDGVAGAEIWASDGTAANTVMLKDIYVGAGGSAPGPLVVSNGKVFFMATDLATGHELYTTDGTPANTQLVVDLYPGPRDGAPGYAMTAFGRGVIFGGATAAVGGELFFSDGTAAGTVLVKDLNQGTADSSAYQFTNVNGIVYMQATDGVTGGEPFRSDGTAAGTFLLRDIWPGPGGSGSGWFTPIGGTKCVFAAEDPYVGTKLWISDGTVAGTQILNDISTPGAKPGSSDPASFVSFHGKLWFSASDGNTGTELWTSDGTTAGTALVKDINPGSAGSQPASLMIIGDTLFFTATDGVNGTELWKSDGTAAGTTMVSDIDTGASSSWPANLKNVAGTLFFTATAAATGTELYRSDGTAAGTRLILDIAPGLPSGVLSTPTAFAVLGNLLYFAGDDGVHGAELWKSDGTAAGTVMVKDLWPGAKGSLPYPTFAWHGRIYTQASDGTTGFELWQSDGTAAGTILLKGLNTWGGPENFFDAGATLLFSANTSELWKTDGTTAGTVLVTAFASFSSSSSIVLAGDRVFFASFSGAGRELWVTDGTAANTLQVKDIYPGLQNGVAGYFLYALGVGRRVLFVGNDGVLGAEFWVSDGTAVRTKLLNDLAVGPSSGATGSAPFVYVAELGLGFVAGNDGTTGNELYAFTAAQLGISEVLGIGASCKGFGDPAIGAKGVPAAGNAAFAVTLAIARPTTAASLVLAATRSDLPLGSCTVYPSLALPIVANTSTDATGGAAITLPIPSNPALIGSSVFGQWAVADPGGPLFGALSLSNGVKLRIGGS